MNETWIAVDRYLSNLFIPRDAALEETLCASKAAGLPEINVTANQGKLLHLLARIQGARRILELGTLAGYSTIWLARALPADGRLITLEADARHAEVARANILRAGLGAMVDIRVGRALDTLPRIAAEDGGPFDLVFVDADKPSYPDYLPWVLQLSRPGSLIIADNIVRQGAIVDPKSEDPNVRGVRRFNELLAAEPRLSTTAIQTVGSKGYDGFTISLVTCEGSDLAIQNRSPKLEAHAGLGLSDSADFK